MLEFENERVKQQFKVKLFLKILVLLFYTTIPLKTKKINVINRIEK